MRIKTISPLIFKGKFSGLYNYQYLDSDGQPISATFQASKNRINQLKKLLTK